MRIINLLPKPKQEELKYELIFHNLLIIIWIAAFSFVLVFGVQIGTKVYVQYKLASVTSAITQLQQQVDKNQNAVIKTQIDQVNNVISDYKNLSDSSPQWSGLIKAFAPLVPQTVQINSLSVDSTNKSVTIAGLSPTRDLVIELYNNILSDTADFSGIDYPLENVAKPVNVNFHFTFQVKDSVIEPQ